MKGEKTEGAGTKCRGLRITEVKTSITVRLHLHLSMKQETLVVVATWSLHLARTNWLAGEVVAVTGARMEEAEVKMAGDAVVLDRGTELAQSKATKQSEPEMHHPLTSMSPLELGQERQTGVKCRRLQENAGLMERSGNATVQQWWSDHVS